MILKFVIFWLYVCVAHVFPVPFGFEVRFPIASPPHRKLLVEKFCQIYGSIQREWHASKIPRRNDLGPPILQRHLCKLRKAAEKKNCFNVNL